MSNSYTYSPPCTTDELYRLYWGEGLTQKEVSCRLGVTQKVIWRAMHKAGIPTRKQAARNQKGEANNNWRGGRVLSARVADRPNITSGGYWYVYDPCHPNSNRGGYVAEHIKIATSGIPTGLPRGCCVHHVDLNKRNNSKENLAVCDRKQHAEWHNQLEEIAVAFMRAGWVSFSSDKGYSISREVPNCP